MDLADVYRIGTYLTDVMTGKSTRVVVAYGSVAAAGARNLLQAGVNYQVTAGKTFKATAVFVDQCTLACSLVYADNSALTTNRVVMDAVLVCAAGAANLLLPTRVTAPASKYVGLWNSGGSPLTASVAVIGYEE